MSAPDQRRPARWPLTQWLGSARGRLAACALAGVCALVPAAAGASTTPWQISLSNIDSVDAWGAAGNLQLQLLLAPRAYITEFWWTVDLVTYGNSWLQDITLDIGASDGSGIEFSPASQVQGGGRFQGSGFVDLLNAGQAFRLGSDGLLTLYFHEVPDDLPGQPDARWLQATLGLGYSLPVPEPDTPALWLAGLSMLAALRGIAARQRARRDGGAGLSQRPLIPTSRSRRPV